MYVSNKIILTCSVELWRQIPEESPDLIGQYTRVNVYWPMKSHDSLGLWLPSSTGTVSIIFDIVTDFPQNSEILINWNLSFMQF